MKTNGLKSFRGYLYAICSALIYGCMPLMAKGIYAQGVSPATLVFLRNFLAVPVLAVLVAVNKNSFTVPVKRLPGIGLIAVFGCCLTPILLFSSYTHIPSGTATVLHFVYPALVVVAGMLFLGRKISKGNLISVILCLLGISFFYDKEAPLNWQGSALALMSGVTFAAYVLMLSGFDNKGLGGFTFSFYIAAISSVFMLVYCLITGSLSLPVTVKGWMLCAVFALGVTVGAVVLFQQGTFLIGGEKTSILSTLEPITSVVIGAIVLHEKFSLGVAAGSVLVVSASILIVLSDVKNKDAASC